MPAIQQGKQSFSLPNSAVGLEAAAGAEIFQSVLRSYHAKLTQVEERSVLFPQQFPLGTNALLGDGRIMFLFSKIFK